MIYTHNITEFPNNLCNPHRFALEIKYAIPGKTLNSVVADGPDIHIDIGELDPTELGTLVYLISIHTGAKVPVASVVSASRLKEEAYMITNTGEWQVVAGTIARPLFFHPVAEEIIAQVVGEVNTVGADAQIKIVEQKDGEAEIDMMNPISLPNTEGQWQKFSYTTTVPPRSGLNNYVVSARLQTASACSIRYTSMTMLKVV